MTSMRYILFFSVMLAGSLQAQNWLSPSKDATGNPVQYTFLEKGTTMADGTKQISLPSAEAPGWSVFNAPSKALEAEQSYEISAEDKTNGELRFNEHLDNKQTFLALGISQDANDTTQNPVAMTPTADNKIRVDSVYAKVRFVECAEVPDITMLKEMYPSYDESQSVLGDSAVSVAAKLGVFVDAFGRFQVARMSADAIGTGEPEDYAFEFVESKYTYSDVDANCDDVTIRIEFRTYCEDGDTFGRRAFRIYAQGEAADGMPQEKCLTEGLGYPWLINEDGNYQFDFSKLGEGEWFYALDSGVMFTGANTLDASSLDTLNRLAVSATAGGFYSAWMEMAEFVDHSTLATYETAQFTSYVATTNMALHNLYTDWATKYNVDLTDYLVKKTEGVSLFSATTSADTERAFDAFLLYMDPATNAPLRLTVTGIVPEGDTLSFTVTGPEGCDLREAATRAARLRIRRAADLASLATAEAKEYDIAFSADGASASFALPKLEAETELPFLQATLVPVADVE